MWDALVDIDVRKAFVECIVLDPKAPGIHSGRVVEIVTSSSRVKSSPFVESGGKVCYSSKETSIQGLASEQSRIFAFAVRSGAKCPQPSQ